MPALRICHIGGAEEAGSTWQRLQRAGKRPVRVVECGVGEANASGIDCRDGFVADPLPLRFAQQEDGQLRVHEREVIPAHRRADAVAEVGGGHRALQLGRLLALDYGSAQPASIQTQPRASE